MAFRTAAPTSIDEYILASPDEVQPILEKIRRTIRAAAPGAQQLISYRMPAFRLHGILVYFAAFRDHIGLYPPVSGDAKLEKALLPYAGPKGNLKFPLDRPIPYALIKRVMLLRVKQATARAVAKKRNR
ncbi:MAG: iron chaperone [Thermoanaerobaculia bacterium]